MLHSTYLHEIYTLGHAFEQFLNNFWTVFEQFLTSSVLAPETTIQMKNSFPHQMAKWQKFSNAMMRFWNNPIYPLLSGCSLRHALDKVTWWHFQSTSKEVNWPQFFFDYMHGLKSAILTIFQKGLGWPCPVSAALKNAS